MESTSIDKRLEKGEETYKRILTSAIELISESGISGISASKLSARSNISKSTIFHHFATTKDIPKAVLELLMAKLLSPLGDSDAENLSDFLIRLGSHFINSFDEDVKVYKTFFSFYNESIFHKDYQIYMHDYLNRSKIQLAEKISALSLQQISEQEAGFLSSLMIATLDGIGMHILIGGEKEEYQSAWELQVERLISA